MLFLAAGSGGGENVAWVWTRARALDESQPVGFQSLFLPPNKPNELHDVSSGLFVFPGMFRCLEVTFCDYLTVVQQDFIQGVFPLALRQEIYLLKCQNKILGGSFPCKASPEPVTRS